jgi:PST family polysaccharide transporter
LVGLIFGSRWEPVVALARIFCFVGMLGSIGTTASAVFKSQGRPDIEARLSFFVVLPLTVLAVWLGLPYGVQGVAVAYALRTILVFGLSHTLANRLIGLGWSDFLSPQWRGYAIAVVAGLSMLIIGDLAQRVLSPVSWIILVLKVGVGVSVTVCLLLRSAVADLAETFYGTSQRS